MAAINVLIGLDHPSPRNHSERVANAVGARYRNGNYQFLFVQPEVAAALNARRPPLQADEVLPPAFAGTGKDFFGGASLDQVKVHVVAPTWHVWRTARASLRQAGFRLVQRAYHPKDPRNLRRWAADKLRGATRSAGSGTIKVGKRVYKWTQAPPEQSARKKRVGMIVAFVVIFALGGSVILGAFLAKAIGKIRGPGEGAKVGVIYHLVSIDYRARNVTVVFADRNGSQYTVQTPITAGAELRLRQTLGAEKMQPDDKVLEVGTGRIVKIPCAEPITGVAGRKGCWGSIPQIQIRQR